MPYPSNGKLYAIGDPHSDPESTLLSLRAAGLASPRWEWTGGRSVLIVIGDVADRGESSIPKVACAATQRGASGWTRRPPRW